MHGSSRSTTPPRCLLTWPPPRQTPTCAPHPRKQDVGHKAGSNFADACDVRAPLGLIGARHGDHAAHVSRVAARFRLAMHAADDARAGRSPWRATPPTCRVPPNAPCSTLPPGPVQKALRVSERRPARHRRHGGRRQPAAGPAERPVGGRLWQEEDDGGLLARCRGARSRPPAWLKTPCMCLHVLVQHSLPWA